MSLARRAQEDSHFALPLSVAQLLDAALARPERVSMEMLRERVNTVLEQEIASRPSPSFRRRKHRLRRRSKKQVLQESLTAEEFVVKYKEQQQRRRLRRFWTFGILPPLLIVLLIGAMLLLRMAFMPDLRTYRSTNTFGDEAPLGAPSKEIASESAQEQLQRVSQVTPDNIFMGEVAPALLHLDRRRGASEGENQEVELTQAKGGDRSSKEAKSLIFQLESRLHSALPHFVKQGKNKPTDTTLRPEGLKPQSIPSVSPASEGFLPAPIQVL